MALRTCGILLALAAAVAASVAGGWTIIAADRSLIGAARAQSDPASRTLRLAPGDIVSATYTLDAYSFTPVVQIRFSRDAASRVRAFMNAHINRKTDLKVDGRVISSPVIRGPITGESLHITGTFPEDEGRAMARAISAGRATVEISLAD